MPILRYTLLRLALIAGAFAALWLLGLRGWLVAVLAVVVGALLSYLLLPRQADAAAEVLARRSRKASDSLDDAIAEDAAAEDALLDGENPDARR